MIVGIVLIGLGAIRGITGLRQDLGVALDANSRLRGAYEVGFQVALARTWLNQPTPDSTRAAVALNAAIARLDEHLTAAVGDASLSKARADVSAAQAQIGSDIGQAARSLDDALGELARFSTDARNTILTRQAAADAKHRATLIFVAGLSIVIAVIALAVGRWQYQSVVGPLRRMSHIVQRMAGGKLDERLPRKGDAEFVQLSDHFNHMADQLDDLYRSLEQRVATKSKELIRSERLASVGYLAAGVAHEINNPLGIITGYSERALARLDGTLDDAAAQKVTASLKVICEEAFRAKGITDRLLSMARPASESRRVVSLPNLVREVIDTLCGLARFADRTVTFGGEKEDAQVTGSVGELKQVVMNLLVNAMEAVTPPTENVTVSVGTSADWVELAIADKGRGMTPATLDRVFEPFFTDRPRDRPGTGLGLSICHAIVVDHGGSIHAESAGPGLGSRFLVRFPRFGGQAAISPAR
jgi:signal transduction histidine kinase